MNKVKKPTKEIQIIHWTNKWINTLNTRIIKYLIPYKNGQNKKYKI